ncbi:hypothetical protein [Pseudoduganella sp.]|uniref:hypothetical protein n=1 Tax=Pseudoduganella sp. TaxID=1880898 RepID=UPI0035B2A976
MKSAPILLLAALAGSASASCPSSLPLQGALTIATCPPMKEGCVPAEQALHSYMQALPDAGDEVLRIGAHGSPWHLYGADYRILGIGQLAGMVRAQGGKIRRVLLLSSWSAVAPDRQRKALAQQLAQALGGMPVEGQDGFVWLDGKGGSYTTRQAASLFAAGPYAVEQGSPVMAALAAGWPAMLEAQFMQQKEAGALLRAGVGHEMFSLCPERALAAFEAAAALAEPVAAYNAAILRLERNARGDAQAARALLQKAAAQGDQPSAALLASLARNKKPEGK